MACFAKKLIKTLRHRSRLELIGVLYFGAVTGNGEEEFKVRFLQGIERPSNQPFLGARWKMNDKGQIVGNLPGSAVGYWENGQIYNRGIGPISTSTSGFSINNLGEIACLANRSQTALTSSIAISSPDGSWEYSGFPESIGFTIPSEINNSGSIVGAGQISAGQPGDALLLPNGSSLPILLNQNFPNLFSSAFGMNDGGQVCGVIFGNVNEPFPFTWSASNQAIQLPSFPNRPIHVPVKINNLGVAVGKSATDDTDEWPVYWKDGLVTRIVATGQELRGEATAINDKNLVVGDSTLGPWVFGINAGSEFNQEPIFLNNAVDSSILLLTADDINEQGQICGQSSQGGYILTPIIKASKSGDWNQLQTWNQNVFPQSENTVAIQSNAEAVIVSLQDAREVAEMKLNGASIDNFAELVIQTNGTISIEAGNEWGSGSIDVGDNSSLTVRGKVNSKVNVGGTTNLAYILGSGTVEGYVTILEGGVLTTGIEAQPLTFTDDLDLDFNSFYFCAPSSDYTPETPLLIVEGITSINSSALLLRTDFTPTAGRILTLIENRSEIPILGRFANLPEGSIINNIFNSVLSGKISYIGGDGNDVTLEPFYPTFESWADDFSISNAPYEIGKNGIPQILNFIYDLDPDAASTRLEYSFGILLKKGTPTIITSGFSAPTFTFIVRKNLPSNISITLESTDNLESWDPIPMTQIDLDNDEPQFDIFSYSQTEPEQQQTRRFFRIEAVIEEN